MGIYFLRQSNDLLGCNQVMNFMPEIEKVIVFVYLPFLLVLKKEDNRMKEGEENGRICETEK